MSRQQPEEATPGASPLEPLTSERLLIDCLPDQFSGSRALVISPGRAQLATHLQQEKRYASVQAWYLDLHDAAQACSLETSSAGEGSDSFGRHPESGLGAETGEDVGTDGEAETGVEILCGADLPIAEYDLIALPVLKRSETELTRDLLQEAHQRLSIGGYLAASVDNPKDNWLHTQLQSMLDKVTNRRTKQGCVYWGKKTVELKKVKDFSCRFAFRDSEDGPLITVISRPGVFSHRRLDPGARQLLLTAEIDRSDHVLDMGCGAGAISLAAAIRTTGTVYSVDSNARAIECVKRGAELNNLTNITPIWNADGNIELPEPIDIALANPPYFGEDTLAQHFVDTCLSGLRSGGALLVVTKRPSWYAAYFDHLLEDVAIMESSRYFVACGRKP